MRYKSIFKILLVSFSLMFINCKKDDEPTFEACTAPEKTFVGDITIHSQEALELFGANNYTKVEGNLNIGQDGGDITDLSPLSCLQEVTGNLGVGFVDCLGDGHTSCNNPFPARNPLLTTLRGLDNLKAVNRTLFIIGNDITDLKGLSSLVSVGRLYILGNSRLKNLNGLSRLSSIGNIEYNLFPALDVDRNKALDNFCSLRNVEIIGDFYVVNNAYNPTQEQLKTDACKVN